MLGAGRHDAALSGGKRKRPVAEFDREVAASDDDGLGAVRMMVPATFAAAGGTDHANIDAAQLHHLFPLLPARESPDNTAPKSVKPPTATPLPDDPTCSRAAPNWMHAPMLDRMRTVNQPVLAASSSSVKMPASISAA